MIGRTVTRVRTAVGPVDVRGIPTKGTITRLDIPGCAVAPLGSDRRTAEETSERGRHGTTTGLSLFDPSGTDLTRDDQIEIDGVLYDIDGDPSVWERPHSGRPARTEVALRRAEG